MNKRALYVFVFILLTTYLAACSETDKIASTEEKIRKEVASKFTDLLIGDIVLTTGILEDGSEFSRCDITILRDPTKKMFMDLSLSVSIISLGTEILLKAYPDATRRNVNINIRPDIANFKSDESMDLDGTIITLGMTREEIIQALETSNWRVVSKLLDHWGLSSRWPHTATVYFENKDPESVAAFLITPDMEAANRKAQ
ncbi:hypothetical protein [Aurantivibrio infirmus]